MLDSNIISKKILDTSLQQNKISHAYLFQIDGSLYDNELIFSFIKEIICPYRENKVCNECNICHRIDSGNYAELKIINPDGLNIKKEQVIELQNSFNKKAIESSCMVYIINEAEKMNTSASNTLLKFLEEPEKGIVAILVTNNVHNMLNTIVSRCQIINLKSNIKNEYDNELVDKVFDLLYDLEHEKLNVYVTSIESINNISSSKDILIKFFEITLLIYNDLLNYLLKNDYSNFIEKEDKLNKLLKYNNKNTIYKKISLIMEMIDNLKYNVNVNMLLDKFIIQFNGGE